MFCCWASAGVSGEMALTVLAATFGTAQAGGGGVGGGAAVGGAVGGAVGAEVGAPVGDPLGTPLVEPCVCVFDSSDGPPAWAFVLSVLILISLGFGGCGVWCGGGVG